MKIQMAEDIKEMPETNEFGTHFAPYLLEMYYKDGEWGEPRIRPYGPFIIEPAMCSLHYGQACFEGQKAYKRADGGLNIFRPMDNFARLNKSHQRMCMPELTQDDIKKTYEGLLTLLKMNAKWVPDEPSSLYIRMHTFASENFIGLRPSTEYKLFIICSPVPPYLNGFAPAKLMIPDKYTRAAPGGTGEAKSAGNYDGTLLPVEEAHKLGYDNCLFLNGNKISECSAANIFFIVKNTIFTPALDGTILHGITRESIIKLCEQHGFDVREEHLSIDRIMHNYNMNELEEIFITGTAACIIPVSELYYKEETIKPNFEVGPITNLLYDELTDILYSRITDNNCWITKVS